MLKCSIKKLHELKLLVKMRFFWHFIILSCTIKILKVNKDFNTKMSYNLKAAESFSLTSIIISF